MTLRMRALSEEEQHMQVGQNMVHKWFKRFREQGLDRLQDAPRPGAPAHYQPEDATRIVALQGHSRTTENSQVTPGCNHAR